MGDRRRRKGESVRRKSKLADGKKNTPNSNIQSERLDPVRVIERELVRPDGTTMKVRVPVYPPFQLKQRPAAKPEKATRKMRKTG
jgi:hypothetical protein